VGGCHLQSEWNGWMEILVGKAVGFYGVVNIIRWDIYFIFRHEISLFIVYIIIFFSLSLAPPLSLSSFTQTTKKLELPLKNTTCKKKKKKKPKVRQTYLRFRQGKSTKNPELEQMVQWRF
jgi:hypothetical protein